MHIYALKIGIDDLIYKAEKETDIQKKFGYQGGKGRVGEMNQDTEINIYTLFILCIKQTTNENLLYSTGNYMAVLDALC